MRGGLFACTVSIATLLAAQSGESIYLNQCAVCHGAKGEGGRGPALARPTLPHAPDDQVLLNVIRRGLPNSGMPATALAEPELQLVVAHVRALGRVAPPGPLTGNAQRGAQVYRGKGGCAGCHLAFGPDLQGIGERRSAAHLRTSLTDPAADLPPGFLMVEAVTLDGRKTIGARVNEDTFSLQLREPNGKVHSYWKSELREWKRKPGQSPMPGYREQLTDEEIDDVVAFLASYKGVTP
jgi:cytochrome c oxidase cbb3-type subunit III